MSAVLASIEVSIVAAFGMFGTGEAILTTTFRTDAVIVIFFGNLALMEGDEVSGQKDGHDEQGYEQSVDEISFHFKHFLFYFVWSFISPSVIMIIAYLPGICQGVFEKNFYECLFTFLG